LVSEHRAWAEIDLGAVRANARRLVSVAQPAQLCAVVKANGYGHGAVEVARAALEGGATWLAVALVDEGLELRAADIDAPVLVLSEPSREAMPDVVTADLVPTLYTDEGVEAAAKAAARRLVSRSARSDSLAGPSERPLDVHVKVDTGMHRVGADPDVALDVARAVVDRSELRLAGVWTHLAVADEPDNPFTEEQLDRFDRVRAALEAGGIDCGTVHAANSAGAIAHPRARHDLVRCGIALYGVAPSGELDGSIELSPVMSVKARVSMVRHVPAGDGISYGLRYRFERPSTVATVPLGYADGVPRALSAGGGEVLIGGRRRPIAGTVTMDQLMVDCGPDSVARGDEVVLIGAQGTERITADEWAQRVGTIAYEIVCGIGPRVPRVHVDH
jgi:alanine racemase